jgi:hypothetical protein
MLPEKSMRTDFFVKYDQWFTLNNSFFLHTTAVKSCPIIIIHENPVSLPCIPVWQIYNIFTIKFRFNQKNWLGEKKSYDQG